MTGMGRALSKRRVDGLIRAARADTHMSVAEITSCRLRACVKVRHGIWRELRDLGFGYTAIARAWGVDHSSVHYALNSKSWMRGPKRVHREEACVGL